MSTAGNPPAIFASPTAVVGAQVQARRATILCSSGAAVPAITSSSIGGAWDVSWHRSIGRDTFWTPAHLAIQACGVVAAIICGYLMLVNTFGRSTKLKDASVN